MTKPAYFLFTFLAVIAALLAGVNIGRALKEIEISNPEINISFTPTSIPLSPFPTFSIPSASPTSSVSPSPTPRARID